MRHITRRRNTVMTASAILALAVAQAAFLPAAKAATLTWDSTGTSFAAPVDGAGIWNTGANWSNGSSDAAWNNANYDTAVFGNGGAPGTVTLPAGATVGGMTFSAVSLPVTGIGYIVGTSGQTLTLGGTTSANGNIVVNSGAGTVSMPVSLQVNANEAVTNNSSGTLSFTNIGIATGSTLTVNGTGTTLVTNGQINGAGGLTLGGTATLILGGSGGYTNYTGATYIGAGTTLQTGNGGSSGFWAVNAPTQNYGNIVINITSGQTLNSGNVISGSGNLIINDVNNNTIQMSDANTYTGSTQVKGGILQINTGGNVSTTAGSLSALTMGGGNAGWSLISIITGRTSAISFSGTTVNTGIDYLKASGTQGATFSLTLGNITRGSTTVGGITNGGGVLDVALPTAGNGAVYTTATNGNGGIIGGWAYIHSTGDWAVNNGGTLASNASGNYATTLTGATGTTNFRGSGNNTIASGGLTLNSINLNGASAFTINGPLVVNSGGVMLNPSYGGNTLGIGTTVGSGSITSGNGQDLILIEDSNARNVVTVNTPIVDNGSTNIGLTFANSQGTMQVALTAANTFHGDTNIGSASGQTTNVDLQNSLALQNSTLNYNSIGSASTGGSFTGSTSVITFGTPTTPLTSATLGGLKGGQNLLVQNNSMDGNKTYAGTNLALSIGNNNQSTTYSGAIMPVSGSTVSVTKVGSGTLTFSGANTYNGNTTVNAGTLALTNSGSIANSPAIIIASGATFDVSTTSTQSLTLASAGTATLAGSGTMTGALSVASGTTISPGNGAVGTLTIGTSGINSNLTIGSGATLNSWFGAPGTPATQITVNGSVALPASGLKININSASGFAAGTYDIMNFTGLLTGFTPGVSAAGTFVVNSTPTGFAGRTYTFSENANSHEIDMTVGSATLPLTWAGSTSSAWDASTNNWTQDNTNSTLVPFANQDTVTFGDTITNTGGAAVTNRTVTIAAGGVQPNGVAFNNSTGDYTFSNASNDTTGISGSVNITKAGTSTVFLTSPNTFIGTVTINAGAVNLSNGNALGNGGGIAAVTVASGAALQLQGNISAGTGTASNTIPLNLNGTGVAASPKGALQNVTGSNTYTGPVTLASASTITSTAGSLTLTGGITNGGNLLTVNGAGNTTISTTAITGTGGLAYSGSGTLALSGNNTFSGGTTLASGTVSLASDAALGAVPGTAATNLSFSGNSTLQPGAAAVSLNANRNVAIGSAVTATIDTINSSNNLTINGVISGSGAKLTKINPGTLTLTGANTYTGGTTINGGSIVANGSSLGSGAVVMSGGSNLALNGVVKTLNLTGQASTAVASGVNGANVASNGFDASVASRWESTQFVDPQWIYINLGGTYNVVGTSIDWETSNAKTMQIQTAPSSTNVAAYAPNENGSNSTANNGWTTVLNVPSQTPPAGTATVPAYTAYALTPTNAQYIAMYGTARNPAGDGNLYGYSFWDMQVTVNSYTTYTIGSLSSSDATTTIALDAVSTLNTGSDNTSTTFAGAISGAGNLTKTGTGNFTLTNAHTYTGATTVSAGTLTLTGSASLGNTAITVANNATLAVNPTTSTITAAGSLTLANGGSFDMRDASPAGTFSLTSTGTNLILGSTAADTTKLGFDLTATGADLLSTAGTASVVAGLNTINIATPATGSLTAGTYTLISANGGLSGTFQFPNLSGAETVTVGSLKYLLTLSDSSTALSLTVAAAGNTLTWLGGSSWNTGSNWDLGSAPGNLDTAVFNSSAAAPTVTAGSSVLNMTFDTASVGALNLAGSALNLSNNGTIDVTSSVTNNQTISAPLALQGNYTLKNDSAAALTVSGGITATTAAGTLTLAGTGNGTISQTITDSGSTPLSLVKNGTGTWSLTTANSITGSTLINSGVLNVASGALGSSGTITFDGSGGTLQYAAGNTDDISGRITGSTSPISLDTGANNVTFANSIAASNTAGLTKIGSGTLTLSGNNAYTGITKVNAGTLALNSSSALGNSSSVNIATGSTLQLANNITISTPANLSGTISSISGNNTYSGSISANPTTVINTSAASSLTISGGINTNGNAVTVSGAGPTSINGTTGASITGSGSVNYAGTSTLTLSGSHAYTGGTTIASGIIAVAADNAIGNGGTIAFTGNATLQAANTVHLAHAVSVAPSVTATFDTTGGSMAIGAISGGNSSGIVKTGGGTLTLNGANSYAGTTTITSGTLQLTPNTSVNSAIAPVVQIDVSNASTDGNGNFTYLPNLGTGGGSFTGLGYQDAINGHQAINVGGKTTGFTSTNAYTNTTQTVTTFVLATSGNSAAYQLLSFIGPNSNQDYLGAGNMLFEGTATTAYSMIRNGAGPSLTLPLTGGYSSGNPFIIDSSINTALTANDITSSIVTTDGVGGSTTTTPPSGQIGTGTPFNINTMGIGARYNGSTTPTMASYNGDIGEVLVYNAALTPTQVAQVQAYLEAKWLGIGTSIGNLPTATPVQLASGATLDLNGTNQQIASLSDYNTSGGGTVTSNTSGAVTLTLAPTANATFSGSINNGYGTVGLTLAGTANQTFTGQHTYTGPTLVNTGTLTLAGSASLATPSITVAGGATLAVKPTTTITAGGSLTLNSGSTFDMRDGNAGTFSLASSLAISSANLGFDVAATGVDELLTAGSASVTGTNFINLQTPTSGTLTPGTYTLISANGGLTGTFEFSDTTVTKTVTIGSNKYVMVLGDSANALTLLISTTNIATWLGGSSWNTAANWDIGVVPGGLGSTSSFDGVIFNSAAPAPTVDATRNVLNVTFDTASVGALNLSGGSGNHPLTLSPNGSIDVTSTVVNSQVISAPVALQGNTTLKNDSTLAGLALTGGITSTTATGTLTLTGAGSGTISGTITDSGSTPLSIVKNGSGTWSLTTANSITGSTVINTGILSVASGALGSTGAITFAGGSLQYASGNTDDLSGRITGSASPISVDTGSNNVTFANSLASSNTAGLTKLGSGTLTLATANAYAGTTNVNAGTLGLANNSALGGSTSVNVASGANLQLSNGVTIATPATLSGTLSNLSGANTYSAPVTLAAPATLSASAGSLSVTGTVSGTSNLTIAGAGTGTVNLSANNTYSGGTTFASGTLNINADAALGTGNALTFSGNATLQAGSANLALSNARTISVASNVAATIDTNGNAMSVGNISGAGGLTKIGTGTLALTGGVSNTYSGPTVITAGTLQLNAAPVTGAVVQIDAAQLSGPAVTSVANIGSGGGTFTGTAGIVTGTAGINGHQALSFNGSSNVLASTNAYTNTGSGATIFVVANSPNGSAYSVLSFAGPAGSTDWNTVGNLLIEGPGGGTTIADRPNGQGAGAINLPAVGTPMIFDTTINTTLAIGTDTGNLINPNGTGGLTTATMTNNLAAAGLVPFNIADMAVGGRYNGSYTPSFNPGFTGDIGEVLIYNTALTAAQTAQVQAYLESKWFGIGNATGNLPTASAVQVASGATLDLNGLNQQVASLNNYNSAGGLVTSSAAGAITLTLAPSAPAAFSGVIQDGAGTVSLAIAGSSTQTLNGVNTFTGGITIKSGTLAVSSNAALSTGAVTVNNGTLDITNSFTTSRSITLGTGSPTIEVDAGTQTLGLTGTGSLTKTGSGQLNVATLPSTLTVASGILQLTAGTPHTLETLASLTISGGTLDLTNHDLFISGGAASLSSLANKITTSGTNSTTVIALLGGSEYLALGKTNIDGTTVHSGDLVGVLAYAGDANLDGKISADDYLALNLGYMFNLKGWSHGDFAQTGTVTAADFAIIDNNYLYQSGSVADGEIALHTQWFGAAYTDAFNALNAPAAVPEPASLGLLGLGAVALLRRKNRK